MNLLKYLSNGKYRMFHKKLADVQTAIWEQDFKITKSRQIREGVRQDRERAIEAIARIDAVLLGETDAEKKKLAEADKAKFTEDVRRYEGQMKMVDQQIAGVPAVGEDPGVEGITDRIKALSELRAMYKEYLKTL